MACSGLDRQKWSYNAEVSLYLKLLQLREDFVVEVFRS
jgi:hypothetical protein